MTAIDWRTALQGTRKSLGMTRADLARLSGISADSLRAYEVGRRKPSRQKLDAILHALRVDRLEANQIRHDLGFAADYLRMGMLAPTFMFSIEELRQEVEHIPWPEFVVDENMQVVIANSVAQKIWGVDLRRELLTPPERNMLRLASDPRFADRVVNWDEMMLFALSIWKGHHQGPESLESPSPYLQSVLEEFMKGDPKYVGKLFSLWQNAPAKTPKVRDRYRVVWRDSVCGEMRFIALVTTASEWQGLSFNDWHPTDAASWEALTRLVNS